MNVLVPELKVSDVMMLIRKMKQSGKSDADEFSELDAEPKTGVLKTRKRHFPRRLLTHLIVKRRDFVVKIAVIPSKIILLRITLEAIQYVTDRMEMDVVPLYRITSCTKVVRIESLKARKINHITGRLQTNCFRPATISGR